MKAPFEESGCDRRGAQMGRASTTPGFLDSRYPPPALYLRKVSIDSGGYDPGGAYWGHGDPLYCAWTDSQVYYTRAATRDAAKARFEAEEGHALRWKRK